MIKKAILATTFLVVAPAILWVVDPGGHVSTITGYFGEWFKPSLNYQIRLAENLIEKLDDTIVDQQQFLAREKVELVKLEETLEGEAVAVQLKQNKVVALRDRMRGEETPVSIGKKSRNDLARQLSRLKIMDRKHATHLKIFEARKRTFDSSYEKVAQMQESKEQMKLKLQYLKAELEAVRVDEARANYTVDDGDFKRAESLLDEIDTEVKTRQELAEMRRDGLDEPPIEEEPLSEDVLDEVDAYLLTKDAPKVAEK